MTATDKKALEIFSRAIPWLRGYAYTMRAATHGVPSETTIELERFIDLEFLPALAAIPSETGGEDKLVNDLHELAGFEKMGDHYPSCITEAADRIESLQAQLAKAHSLLSVTVRDEHERDKEALKQARFSVAAQLASLRDENMNLHERLEDNHVFRFVNGEMVREEIEPGSIPDGINCRDETIKELDRQLASLRERVVEECAPGTCKCGCAPINKDGLCATCADELTYDQPVSEEKP